MQTPEPSSEKFQEQRLPPQTSASSTRQTASSKEKDFIPSGGEQGQGSVDQTEKAEIYSDEAILKGFIYPPPPWFYEKMQEPIQPAKPARQVPPIPYTPEAAKAATSYVAKKSSSPTATGISSGAARQGQPTTAKRPAVKSSRTWIWVVAAIMGVAFIASCSLCGWVVYGPLSNAFQEALSAQNTINAYYSDLQAKNYLHAYTYLALTGNQQTLTQAQFVQQANQQDQQSGPILSYTPNTPAFSTNPASQGTDINQSTVTVQIGRKQKQYTATITLLREGNSWKITHYSAL